MQSYITPMTRKTWCLQGKTWTNKNNHVIDIFALKILVCSGNMAWN
jgi:hypothetical protein